MKKIILLLLSISTFVDAQYKIDLRNINYPQLTYLKMGNAGPSGKEIRINNLYMEEGGIPQLPVMGEVHYSRINPEYWRDVLLKMKASGINIVSTYCLWNLHEEMEGQISWSGHLNLHRFVKLCKDLGLKVHLRIGPYCNAELRNGGLPDWIVHDKRFESRSNDPLYLAYVRRWYKSVYKQVEGLLYKDGGPVFAIQIENEYVKKGMVIPHLTTLKKIAVETGFDVPLYSMTHWMDSEFPKGEIVPYAGYYIEAPWTSHGKEEIPTGNFEFFTYDRLSDNIGTDIIKVEGKVASLSGENNVSPFFTCEVGVGTTAFYHRRAVVPEEMAGEMINLRLGCGVNLMGYYMYAGGTNPKGKITTMQSSGPRICYDYQAPIREFGTMGQVMPEVKKYNFFINDFGTDLAPLVAYLPTSNQDRNNLQWAVRTDGEKGYLFCSNYLYKHERGDYKNVQFNIKLKEKSFKIPRNKVTIKGGSYFFWPFNQIMGGVSLKYSTTQPICSLSDKLVSTFFFFQDDNIPAEYLLDNKSIKEVHASKGSVKKEKNGWFINNLTAGKDCVVEIMLQNGSKVRFVTLTEDESDLIWKGKVKNKDYVALTDGILVNDQEELVLISEQPRSEVEFYNNGRFYKHVYQKEKRDQQVRVKRLSPMSGSQWITSMVGNKVEKKFTLNTLSTVEHAYLRYISSHNKAKCSINGTDINAHKVGDYYRADVTSLIQSGENAISYFLSEKEDIISEVEILLKNGERRLWQTDATWSSIENNKPVRVVKKGIEPIEYADEEHLKLYKIYIPESSKSSEEKRMYISYHGNVANLYQEGQLIADSYYDGTDWIVSVDRLKDKANVIPLILRIEGLKSKDDPIYFEKDVDPEDCVIPSLSNVLVKQESRFEINLKQLKNQ